MDKAYVDFEALYRKQRNETYFVTRPKDTMRFEVVETNNNINDMVGIVSDRAIRLTITAKKYPEDLRMVMFHDAVNDEVYPSSPTTWSWGRLSSPTSTATAGS